MQVHHLATFCHLDPRVLSKEKVDRMKNCLGVIIIRASHSGT